VTGPKSCEGEEGAGQTGGGTAVGPTSSGAVANGDDQRGGECQLPGRVCLFGGGSNHEGNVHVGGKPVCDDSWDMVQYRDLLSVQITPGYQLLQPLPS
jgi:hypothetical protein